MLVFTRKLGETIVIGEDIFITILEKKNNGVKVGIRAPKNVQVHREEVFDRIQLQMKNCKKEDKNPTF